MIATATVALVELFYQGVTLAVSIYLLWQNRQ